MTDPALKVSLGRNMDAYVVYYKADDKYMLQFQQDHEPWYTEFSATGHTDTPYKSQLTMSISFENAESIRVPIGMTHDRDFDIFFVPLDCMDLIRFSMFGVTGIKVMLDNGIETFWPISDSGAIQRCLVVLLKYTAFNPN